MGGDLLNVENGVDAGVDLDGAFFVDDGGDGGVEGVDCFAFFGGNGGVGEEQVADRGGCGGCAYRESGVGWSFG